MGIACGAVVMLGARKIIMGLGSSKQHGMDRYTNQYELAIRASKELEGMLVDCYGATGTGLHGMVSSVESKLSPALCRKLRYIATMRNKLIHERFFSALPDEAAFRRCCSECIDELIASEFAPQSSCIIV